MQQEYVPKAVKAGKFEGSLILKLLSFDERFGYVERSQAADSESNTAFMVKLVKEFRPKFEVVTLTRKSDGKVFLSYDDLLYGPECHAILIDAATWLLNGDEEAEKPKAP